MLGWVLTFFILALVAAAFGFSGLAASFSWIAQVLAVVFIGLLIVSIIMGGLRSASNGHVP